MARKLSGIVAAVALASGAMFTLVGPASAQVVHPNPDPATTLTINVHKVITGAPSSDQTYTVQVTCTVTQGVATVNPSTTQPISWDLSSDTFSPSSTVTFTVPTVIPQGQGTITCTVSETNDDDATSHTVACNTQTVATCNNAVVTIPSYSEVDGTANLTVTNNYPDPVTTTTPATTTRAPTTTTLAPRPVPRPLVSPAVVAAAHFTG